MEGFSMMATAKRNVTSNVFGKKAQNNEVLLVRKIFGNRMMSLKESQRENIFQVRCRIQGHLCALIIDGESFSNLVSLRVVSKLGLKTTPHPRPYMLQWSREDVCFDVKEQVTLEFSISNYHDKVVCDVIPMEAHVLLGGSWLYKKRACHYGYKNKYKFFHDGKWMSLVSLSPKEVYEDQCKLRKQIEQESKSETLVSKKESMSETLESETLVSENERQRESKENTLSANTLSANTLSEKQKGELCLNSDFSNHTLVNNVVCLDFQVAQEEVPKGTLTIAPSLKEDKIMKNNQGAELCSRPIHHCPIGSNYLNNCMNDRLGAALPMHHDLIHRQHPRALEHNVHISLLQPYRSFHFVLVSLSPFVESSLDPCHNFVLNHASLHLVRNSIFGFLVSFCVKHVHGSNLNLLLELSLISNNHAVLKSGFVVVVFDPGGWD